MGVNRVDFGGNTLIDLTGDTLESAEQLLKGIIAHAKDGSVITGLMEAGGGGGGDFDFSNLADINFANSGSFTPTSNAASIFITDPEFLKITPKIFILYTESVLTGTDSYRTLLTLQAHISDNTGFVFFAWTKGFTSILSSVSDNKKCFKFNATPSYGSNGAYLFTSSNTRLTPCSITTSGFIIRGCSYSSNSTYTSYFEEGATYKYIYMGVKNQ